MVATVDRVRLDKFTRDIWKRFDDTDLTKLRDAIIRRRRDLAPQILALNLMKLKSLPSREA